MSGHEINIVDGKEINPLPVVETPVVEVPVIDKPVIDTTVVDPLAPVVDPLVPAVPEVPVAPQFFWGDNEVDVDVPEDITAAFAEKGIDVNLVVGELFAKDGKFELTPDTRAKLDEAFGAHAVTAYLGLYKLQNENSAKEYTSAQESLLAQKEANTTEFHTLVGGEEGWDGLAEWAESTLDDKQLAAHNAVMQLGPEHWQVQKTVVEALKMKREAADKAANGDTTITLIGDESAGAPVSGALPRSLTKAEFQAAMGTEKYQKDKAYAAQIDNVRRSSQKAGIS